MSRKETLYPVDYSAMKVNQVMIILLGIIAFVVNAAWLVALVALIMLAGTVLGTPGFAFVYRHLLKPRGWVKPNVILDNPEPHRFAQGFGGIVLLSGALALYAGAAVLGWVLVWLVIILAGLNAFGNFCVGCFVYYWLARLRTPGFDKQPPAGTFPGTKPQSPGKS